MTHHEDERPAQSRLLLSAIEAVRRDPEGFGRTFFHDVVRGGSGNAAATGRASDNAALSESVRQLEHQKRQLSAELAKVKARRDRLQELYANQTERVEKFKGAFEALRDSPEYTAGRKLYRPRRLTAAFARRLLDRPAGGDRHSADAPNADSQRAFAATTVAQTPSKPVVAPDRATAAQRPGGAVALESVQASGDVPSATDETPSLRTLKFDFYKRGRVRSVARGLLDLDGEGGAGRTPDEAFERTVTGWLNVMDHPPSVGPRQSSPAYFVERDRVLYCAHNTGRFNSNGYATRTAGLTQALARQAGEDLIVVARAGYPWDAKTQGTLSPRRTESVIDGVRHVFNPGPSLTDQPLDEYLQSAADVYAREAVRFRAGLIHAASNHLTALPALIAARRLGIPFVYEVRGLWEITETASRDEWEDSERYQVAVSLESLVAREADRVLAITSQVAEELVRRGVSRERIAVVPNAADTARFIPGNADKGVQRRLGLNPGEPVIGYAGSLVAYEGIDLLLDAMWRLVSRGVAARLVIVGDGPALPALKARVSELGIADAVIFTGRVPNREIPRYLSVFTVAPIPRLSNVVTELVSPIKPLEALAAGVAVVASDVAPLRDIVGDQEERGLLFRAGDAESLAKALERVLVDRRLRGDIVRRGRQWVAKERTWDKLAVLVAKEHAVARSRTAEKGRELAALRMGLIADEFTTRAVAPECQTVPITMDNWRRDIAGIDVLLVESAWEGNGGEWTRRVGYYGDVEAQPLTALVNECRKRGVPTVFWNKEDPVHLERFVRTAALFDHVFTTDANCIPRYWSERGEHTQSVASLPFFAQPSLHRPLAGERAYSHTVAYGGSYYGDRYPERSKQLLALLEGVGPDNVTIYDRQVNHPNSIYVFPDELRHRVHGGLSYGEMTQAYRAHPVHINVNSVNNSPTMFSRRVTEVAACGTPQLSWWGPGILSTIGEAIPSVVNGLQASLLSKMWLTDEALRLEDGWRAHRAIYRAHLAGHRLAYMLRTAGLRVDAAPLPAVDAAVRTLGPAETADILRQTLRPARVLVEGTVDPVSAETLAQNGIEVVGVDGHGDDREPAGYTVRLESGADRTMVEDLLRSALIEPGYSVQRQENDLEERGHALLELRPPGGGGSELHVPGSDPNNILAVRRRNVRVEPPSPVMSSIVMSSMTSSVALPRGKATVLIAGHDMKFAGDAIRWMEDAGHKILVDTWENHTDHDEAASRGLLAQADVVFCEWALGNVKWYSENKRPGQRLVSRFHSQELFTPYLGTSRLDRVDGFIFVGELIRQAALTRFAIEPSRTSVIPNTVDLDRFTEPRPRDARFNIGMVGMVPGKKRVDLALDVLAALRGHDERFRLHVKGRQPSEYPWMAKRPDEVAFYEEQYRRIAEDPLLRGAVQFDGHGDDMPKWYAEMGAVLSVSDFESFHLTLPDGAASGAVPLSLSWPGSELIYPASWLFETVGDLAGDYLRLVGNDGLLDERRRQAREFVEARFDAGKVLPRLVEAILGG